MPQNSENLQPTTCFPFDENNLFNHISQINKRKSEVEKVVSVNGAKVVYANYPLLMNDFPQLEETELLYRHPNLKHLSPEEKTKRIQSIIDKWLVKHSAYVSINQAETNEVNTPIDLGVHSTNAFRPLNYGRALIFSIQDTLQQVGVDDEIGEKENDKGLIDVKGVGVGPDAKPTHGPHHNGLCSLSECFNELLFEQIIHRIFRKENSAHQTLPIYAIIDLGFDIVINNQVVKKKVVEPAGLVLRRAHNRRPIKGDLPDFGTPNYHAIMEIELLLRKYGITSVAATKITIIPTLNGFKAYYMKTPMVVEEGAVKNFLLKICRKNQRRMVFEGVNVQITEDLELNPLKATLVDFGNYRVRKSFKNPILFLASDRVLFWGDVIWPNKKKYIQPNVKICVPYKIWGKDTRKRLLSPINRLNYTLANDCRASKISRQEVINRLEDFIAKATSKW